MNIETLDQADYGWRRMHAAVLWGRGGGTPD